MRRSKASPGMKKKKSQLTENIKNLQKLVKQSEALSKKIMDKVKVLEKENIQFRKATITKVLPSKRRRKPATTL